MSDANRSAHALYLEFRALDERVDEALGSVREDAVADAVKDDLRALRRAVWEPIVERLLQVRDDDAGRWLPTLAAFETFIWPARDCDRQLVQRIGQWQTGNVSASVVDELGRAVAIYKRLVQCSAGSRIYQDEQRVRERLVELRPERDPLLGRSHRASAAAISDTLTSEGVRHPWGVPWSTGAVLEMADRLGLGHLFPGSRKRVVLLPGQSAGPTPVRGADSRTPRFPLLLRRTTNETALAADESTVLAAIQANPGARGANAVVELVRPMRRQTVLAIVKNLVRSGRVRLERTRRNGRRLYAV